MGNINVEELSLPFKNFQRWEGRNDVISYLNRECGNMRDYSSRVIYELLQNADDAGAEMVEIEWNQPEMYISIKNNGNPFSQKGFRAILYSDMSTKQGDENTTGDKGIGFRSVLNWTNVLHIYSAGIHLEFSEDIAQNKWEKVKNEWGKTISHTEVDEFIQECNKVASNQNRKCPMPILAVPEVEKYSDTSQNTEIKIFYTEEKHSAIEDQVNNISSKILIFLRSLKCIKKTVISESGQETYSFEKKIDETRKDLGGEKLNLDLLTLDKSKWYKIYNSEKMAVAFSLEDPIERQNSYLYTYFPTKVSLGLPCLVQAEFDLEQSRNSIRENERNNQLQKKLAAFLLDAAELVASENLFNEDYWLPLQLVLPDSKYSQVHFCLEELMAYPNRELFPALDGKFYKRNETFFYSDDLSSFLLNNNLQDTFEKTCRSGCPETQKKILRPYKDNELSQWVKIAVGHIIKQPNWLDLLAQFIQIWIFFAEKNYQNLSLPILVEDTNDGLQIIEGETALKEGSFDIQIPDFLQLHWFSKSIQEKLINEDLKEWIANHKGDNDNPVRSLTNGLRKIVGESKISYQDKSTIFTKIAPTNQEEDPERIKERVRCLYKSWDAIKDSGTTLPNVYLLNQEGESCPAQELVDYEGLQKNPDFIDVPIPKRFCLMKYDEWNFDTTEVDIPDFFQKLGVRQYTPIRYEKDEAFIRSLEDKKRKDDDYLHVKADNMWPSVPSEFFMKMNLIQAIKLLLNEEVIKSQVVTPTPIKWYNNRNSGSESINESLLAYQIRTKKEHPLFKIRKYIIEDNCFIDDFCKLDKESICSKYSPSEIENFLYKLGGRKRMSDLDIGELTSMINTIASKELLSTQRWYMRIKDAINSQAPTYKCEEEFTLAAKKEGERVWCKNKEIYYSDNRCLPASIMKQLNILDMPLRAGEEQIQRIFGVKRCSEINFEMTDAVENTALNKEFAEWLKSKKIDILLFLYKRGNGMHANTLKEYNSRLDNIKLKFYAKCDVKMNQEEPSAQLKSGEMVIVNNTYSIASTFQTMDLIVNNLPSLRAITEAICMTCKLTSDEVYNKVSSILRNNDEWNRMERENDYSKEDIEHVKAIISGNSSNMDARPSLEEKEKTMREHENAKMEILPFLKSWLHDQLQDKVELHAKFISYVKDLDTADWNGKDNYYAFVNEYLKKQICANFPDFQPKDPQVKDIVPLPEYNNLFQEIDFDSLDEETQSLTFFCGHKEDLEKIISWQKKKEEKTENDIQNVERLTIEMDETTIVNQIIPSANPRNGRISKNPRISDKQKKRLGRLAEKIVIKHLQNNGYKIETASQLSNDFGDDSKHYDLRYSKNNTEYRYLEVKWFGSNHFMMSKGEVKFARDHALKYDLALVVPIGEDKYKIHIIKQPFYKDGNSNYIDPVPQDYVVQLEL